jgi:hypothetical protein
MAAEHFETIPLGLPKLNNEQLAQKCDFLYQIDTEASQRKLAKCVGQSRVQEILMDREVRQMFQKEFE